MLTAEMLVSYFKLVISLLSLNPFCSASITTSKFPRVHNLPPLREQAAIQDAWRKERLENIPNILTKYGVDAWLISQREYAEDTTFWSMKSATQFSARRRTLEVLFSSNITTSKADCESSYTWIDNTPKIWLDLKAILEVCDPKSIAINSHPDIAFAGGLHAGEHALLKSSLGSPWPSRLISEPLIAVEYIATMPRSQISWYRRLMETSWSIISEAFSSAVITPGRTSTTDVEWSMREELQSLNYTTWFHPSVTVLPGESGKGPDEEGDDGGKVIEVGDVVHVDFGVTALGLNTDTQHLGYVLQAGEGDVPGGLKEGLEKANRLQDIVRSNMVIGMTGNEILANALNQAHDEGIEGRIYTHPIGDWGHSAGTLIGMTNLQDGVPVLGDLPLLKDMYFSVELFAEHWVEGRNETMKFFLEEDVFWDEETGAWEWVYGRQEEFHLIGRGDGNGKEMLRVQS